MVQEDTWQKTQNYFFHWHKRTLCKRNQVVLFISSTPWHHSDINVKFFFGQCQLPVEIVINLKIKAKYFSKLLKLFVFEPIDLI